MDVFTCIRTRREVRDFQAEKVPHHVVMKILDAGRLAPSSKNSQPWHFIVLRDAAKLRKISQSTPTGSHIAAADFAIAVVTDPQHRLHSVDGARAVQNMVLAAWGEGVGSCWVSNFGSEVKDMLLIPAGLDLLTIIPFGFPKQKRTGRRKIRRGFLEVAYEEDFGKQIDPRDYSPASTEPRGRAMWK